MVISSTTGHLVIHLFSQGGVQIVHPLRIDTSGENYLTEPENQKKKPKPPEDKQNLKIDTP